jgi:hypothetical protein
MGFRGSLRGDPSPLAVNTKSGDWLCIRFTQSGVILKSPLPRIRVHSAVLRRLKDLDSAFERQAASRSDACDRSFSDAMGWCG